MHRDTHIQTRKPGFLDLILLLHLLLFLLLLLLLLPVLVPIARGHCKEMVDERADAGDAAQEMPVVGALAPGRRGGRGGGVFARRARA